MRLNEDLKEQIKQFPNSPGVYIMKDDKNIIIYVGKALNLRKRAGSYFIGKKDIKTSILSAHVHAVEYIVTQNEYEALLLENNLIKKWNPHYNINLKDGKSYPVIRITNEEFPRVFRTRTIIRDGSDYYGPYTNVQSIDLYLAVIEKLLPLRKCKGRLKQKTTPCLYYHIGRCCAPCSGKISSVSYAEYVKKAKTLLAGKSKDLAKNVEIAMHESAVKKAYEKAAVYRDILTSIYSVLECQEVEDFILESRDYVAWSRQEFLCTFVILQMRNGKLIGRDLFRVEAYGDDEDMVLEFFFRYYGSDEKLNNGINRELPDFMYLSAGIETNLITGFFYERYGKKVHIHVPKQGKHHRIMRMALENAINDVNRQVIKSNKITALKELQKILGLSKIPREIEGFDISHLEGKHPVASLVYFNNGIPDKNRYRRFHIKNLNGKIDDYESIKEVIARRYSRVKNENIITPDLVLIDGGKGQVNAAVSILKVLGMDDLMVIGLAKKTETIYLFDSKQPVQLPIDSPGLKLLQEIRDETHRFALSFNKKLREQEINSSLLDTIPGIGPKRRNKLLRTYGSLQKIFDLPTEEIADTCGIPKRVIELLKQKLPSMVNKIRQ